MSDDDPGAVSRGRKRMTTTVKIGSGRHSVPGEMNFISGDVDIQLSGASEEGGDVLKLLEAIEESVEATVEEFEASEYDETRE